MTTGWFGGTYDDSLPPNPPQDRHPKQVSSILSQGKGGIQYVGEVIAMGPLGPFMTQRDPSGQAAPMTDGTEEFECPV
jgi:hypothetical protein